MTTTKKVDKAAKSLIQRYVKKRNGPFRNVPFPY